LPKAFDGLRVAFLTDIHHGPFVGLDFVRGVVRTTLNLDPDLVLLGGDYSSNEAKYVAPCFEVLAGLRAPLGVFGVLGNHDHWHGLDETKAGMKAAGIIELTNSGVWLARGGSLFRLAGVDDLWRGRPDVAAAVGDATSADACVLLSHNPDVAETLRDPRVGLMLSGHTHGGQVVVPGYGAPIVPSRYGQKYLKGLVEAPVTKVYVSRGLGTVSPPMRFGSRPELTLVTLKSA
jgi:predicted MPP superfamily phosphohydrolase